MDELLAAARSGELPALVVVHGDRALAEPLAERLLAALGEAWGVAPQSHRSVKLPDLIADLRTLSLFEPGKVVAVHQTGLVAEREAAADLLKMTREALPWSGDAESLAGAARAAALRLLQVCRLHDIDPAAGAPDEVLAQLPAELLGADAADAAETRRQLAPLLAAALDAGLRGAGSDEIGLLADLLRDGLPERHLLVLVESAIDAAHPLVEALAARGALVGAGRLSVSRKGEFSGVDALIAELERETGTRIRSDAARELTRRTLREEDYRRGGGQGAVDADSAARFGAEYRKLAALAGDDAIDRRLVAANVEDRGGEDSFKLLDALGEGRLDEALDRIARRLAGAEDRDLERLSLYGLLARQARALVATAGAVAVAGASTNLGFPPFKTRLAPKLVGSLEGVPSNPLKGWKPFPLYRVYGALERHSAEHLARLPALALETERRLKGDSGEADAALLSFAVALAGDLKPAPGGRAGSRARGARGGRS